MSDMFRIPVTSATLPPDGLYPCRCRIQGTDIGSAELYVKRHRNGRGVEICILQDFVTGSAPVDARVLMDSGFLCSWSVSFGFGLYTNVEEAMAGEQVTDLTLIYPVCPEGGLS